MPPAAVTFELAAPREIAVEYEYLGQAAGSREVEIRARVNGIIEKRQYQEGSMVTAGQILFKLDAAPYAAEAAQAEAALAGAVASLKKVERDFARMRPLAESKMISKMEWDKIESGLEIARAQHKAAEARLTAANVDLNYTEIAAPISGVIGRALKVEGALINTGNGDTLLATMAQVDPMHVNFSIAQREKSAQDQEIASGSLKLPKDGFVVRLKNTDGMWLEPLGKLDFVDYKADANTGAYAMRAAFPNTRGELSPGQFMRAVLTGATRQNAFVVPQRAVMDGPMGKFVYLVGKDKDGKPVAEPRPVVPGEWVALTGKENKGWIIRQGLQPGDPVIVDGTARIFAPGQALQPMTVEEAEQAAHGAAQAGQPTEKPAGKLGTELAVHATDGDNPATAKK
ncbi:MAG: efflux RND transporter periplasmic adaptor subunit [Gallionella sp.]